MSPFPKTALLAGLLFLCLTLPVGAEAKPKDAPIYGTPSFPYTPPPALVKQHILNDNFAIAKTLPELPESVQKQAMRLGGEGVMIEPLRRLVLAGTSAGYCFVYARYGGFGSWPSLSLYELSDKKAKLVWRGCIMGLDQTAIISNLPQLRDAISKGKFSSVILPKQPQGSY